MRAILTLFAFLFMAAPAFAAAPPLEVRFKFTKGQTDNYDIVKDICAVWVVRLEGGQAKVTFHRGNTETVPLGFQSEVVRPTDAINVQAIGPKGEAWGVVQRISPESNCRFKED